MGQNRRTRRAQSKARPHRCEHVELAPSECPAECPRCGFGDFSTGLMFEGEDDGPWPMYCLRCGELVAVL